MNFNNHQLALPSAAENDPNEIYTFQSPRRQAFAFPNPIMNYILKNPTPEAWKKLILTCKYFFSKYPVYPVSNFQSRGGNGWFDDRGEIIKSNGPLAKLWLYTRLYANYSNASPTLISSLIPKLAKCDLRAVLLREQNLTFEEYQFLTSSGTIKSIQMNGGVIKYSDGENVTFDKILENLQNVETFIYFYINSQMFKPDTVKKIVPILRRFKKLEYFKLIELTETFDISSIMDFLFENQIAQICLAFHHTLFDAYKQTLDKCFKKLSKILLKN